MESVIAVRSQVPIPALTSQPAPARLTGATADTTQPVAQAIRKDAVWQPTTLMGQLPVALAVHDEDQHPATAARVAAEVAREAYIRASIAAGINPLPVP